MLNDQFLKILRCPVSGSTLRPAESELLERVNSAITAGRLKNRFGDSVTRLVSEGLVNQDRSLLLVVDDGIPSLIADEAIPLEQVAAAEDDHVTT